MAQKYRRNRKRRKRRRFSGGRIWLFVILVAVGVGGLGVAQARLGGSRPGELNAQGLRLTPSGRSDASQVMPAEFFQNPRVREGYAIAHRIPGTLNQLFCWCGCTESGRHRSALECFESTHAANCDVCLANAEVAWAMTQRSVTDAAEIQTVLDARVARL